MYKNRPKTSSFVTTDIIDSMSIEPNDLIDYFKKQKVYSFLEEKIAKGKSNEEASKSLNVSLSTIKRYKKDLGFKPERKTSHKTSEQKHQIYLKGVETKLRNKKFIEEVNNIESSDTLSYDQKQEKINELKNKMINGNISENQNNPEIDIKGKKKNKRNTNPSNTELTGKGKQTNDYDPSEIHANNIRERIRQAIAAREVEEATNKPIEEIMKDLNDTL